MNRKISVSDLTQDAANAFISMMGIINGRCTVTWESADQTQADVLLVTDPNHPGKTQDDKPCIVVYPSSATKAPGAPFTLPHPFRAMQMIKVLEDVARTLPA